MPDRFTISVPDELLEEVSRRVAACCFPIEPEVEAWELGMPVHFMRKVQSYFAERYDWRSTERRLNALPGFRSVIDGIGIHFIHQKSFRPDAVPLLLLHGWPGSILEYENVIRPLCDDENGAGIAFDVVVVSLPGFGFSDPPPIPMAPSQLATLFHRLMTEELGYANYAVQGGDWGSMIAGWMGFRFPQSCRAVHWTMMGLSPGGTAAGLTIAGVAAPETDEERDWASRLSGLSEDMGYAAIQSTKPQTLGFAMADSPMGVIAWILEKFHGWTDRQGAPLEELIPLDRLIDNCMFYVLTNSFASASWMYRSLFTEGNALPVGGRIDAALGMAAPAHDIIPPPPRSYVEKCGNLVHWTPLARGGHFLSLEQPQLWLDDVRQFVASQRAAFA